MAALLAGLATVSVLRSDPVWAGDGGAGGAFGVVAKGVPGAGGTDGDAGAASGQNGNPSASGFGVGGGGGGATNVTTGFGGSGGGDRTTSGVTASSSAGESGVSNVTGAVVGGAGATGTANAATGLATGGGGGGVGVTTGSDVTVQSGGSATGGAGGLGGPASGGGGGGAGVFSSADVTVGTGASVTGGAGGQGTGDGGSGGGGIAVVLGNGGTLTNSGVVTGGRGGNAMGSSTTFGQGGFGGAGIWLSDGGTVINNTGATISGGAPATVSGTGFAPLTGGVGIGGGNVSIVNAGKIAGGSGAEAIQFTGGVNSLEIDEGSTITGNVVAFSTADTLKLGGNVNGIFIAADIGPTAQYQGFGIYEKTGASTWSLVGATTAVTPWTLTAGTLSIGSDGSLGDSAGALTFDGGTLQTRADITMDRATTLAAAGGTIDTQNGTALTQQGQISGSGSLTKISDGTLILTANNTYTGSTTIAGGTLALTGTGSIAASSGVSDNGIFDIAATTGGASITSLSGGGMVNLGAQTLALTAAADTFGGVIQGTGGLSLTGGAQTLTGVNAYTGATTISAGTLALAGTGSIAASSGVSDDGAFDIAATTAGASIKSLSGGGMVNLGNQTLTLTGAADTFGGVIQGTGSLSFAGGTETLTGANTYTGGTSIGAGTLQLGNGGTSGSIAGNVTDNGTLAFDRSDAVSFAGVVSGSGRVDQSGAGSLTLNGANSYSGGTALNGGTLMLGNASSIGSGTLAMAEGTTLDFASSFTLANAITLSGDPTINVATGLSTTLSGGISDGTQAGDLVKTGAGTLVLTGTDTYTGSTEAAAGTLDVEGNLTSSVSVNSGATLVGTGSTGGLTVDAGSTVSPGGAAVGTLTVNGNVSLAAGSMYQLNATDAGSSDLIRATGTAALGGGSVISAEAGSNWSATTKYTILTAAGGVNGTFGSVSSNFAFLTPTLSYDVNDAYLTLVRNAVTFPSVGVTPNEIHTGAATEALGAGNAVYNAVVPLAIGPARATFAELAGDSLASTRTAIIDDSHYVRDAISNHLQGAQGAGETTQSDDQGSVWASTWGHGGNNDGDGNAARMGSNGSGLLVGADRNLDAWRVGAVVGSGQLSNNTTYGSGDAHSTDTVFGLYTGVGVGAWQFQGGAAHSWYQTRSHRQIDVAGIEGRATASYNNGVTQAYVDGGYQFTFNQGSLTPYVDVARVWIHQGAINEGNEAAALDVQANGTAVNYGTAGLRGVYNPSPVVQLHVNMGYQQAWGDLRSIDQQAFVSGGTSNFAVAGVPVAKSSGVLDFGLRLQLSKSVSVDTSYHGQFASHAKDQGARMTLDVAF